jgi:hypothetical protein
MGGRGPQVAEGASLASIPSLAKVKYCNGQSALPGAVAQHQVVATAAVTAL